MKKKKTVLVGVVNRKKDLGIIFKRHWYRIPLRHAPKRIPDYLAFYQTTIFGKNGKRINYYAPVKNAFLLPRDRLLPEERTHPAKKKLYYKFSLGAIKRTPAIKNETRRRISFGFTILDKLKRAREISDLFEITPLEEITRKALKQRGIEAIHEYCLREKGRLKYRLDFAIFSRGRKINVECDNERWHRQRRQIASDKKRDAWLKRQGWMVIRFPGEKIKNNQEECLHYLKSIGI